MFYVDQSMGPIQGYFPIPDTAYFFQSNIQHWGQKLVDIRHIFQHDTRNPHCQKIMGPINPECVIDPNADQLISIECNFRSMP